MPTPNETQEIIRGFQNLPAGWRFGEGIAPSKENVEKAMLLNLAMERLGYQSTTASIGAGGQIQINAYLNNLNLEFYIETDGAIFYAFEQDNHEILEKDNLSITDALAEIVYRGKQWATLDLFTSMITTPWSNDLIARHSVSPAMIEGFQSLTLSASKERDEQSATTSPFTTQTPQERLPFIEKSPTIAFRPVPAS